MSLLTPENLADVLVGLGALLSAIGGWTLWRSRKEPPESGTPDAFKAALMENTWATKKLAEVFEGMEHQFTENNKLFGQTLSLTDAILFEIRESRRELNLMREHLSALRDASNRKP